MTCGAETKTRLMDRSKTMAQALSDKVQAVDMGMGVLQKLQKYRHWRKGKRHLPSNRTTT
jgi:hypothetical protein